MSDRIIFVGSARSTMARDLGQAARIVVSGTDEVARAWRDRTADDVWLADDPRPLFPCLLEVIHERALGRLLLLKPDAASHVEILRTCFRDVVVASESFLPAIQLADVLAAPERRDLFIGGRIDADARVLVLYRGDLSPILAPLAMFTRAGDGTTPDFRSFEVADFGQTLRFGRYEAAADAVLYELDAKYRRRLKAARRGSERGFGASLRRLRLQRGLRQSDFPDLSEKEIGRIERGEVERPHGSSIERIAARLGVRPQDIEDY